MTAYLRSDLWVKSCIYQAESDLASGSSFGPMAARYSFAAAVCVGSISAVIHAIATVLLIIPHTLVCLPSRYVELCGSGLVRQLFADSTGRLQGSVVATGVAFASIFTLHTSANARVYFQERLNHQWADYKQNAATFMQQQYQQETAQGLKSVLDDEIYRLSSISRPTYYETLAQGGVQEVVDYCNATDLGDDVDQSYEAFTDATLAIDLLMREKSRELRSLPVTYLQVGDWRIAEAQKLRHKALAFLDEAAAVERELAWDPDKRAYKKGYNAREYQRGVTLFRAKVRKDFDTKISELKKHQRSMERAWSLKVGSYRSKQRSLAAQVARYQWLMDYVSPVMPDAIHGFFLKRHRLATQQLNAVNHQRLAGAKTVADSVFMGLNRTFFSVENMYNSLVKANGKILRSMEDFAQPGFRTRMWSALSSVLS